MLNMLVCHFQRVMCLRLRCLRHLNLSLRHLKLSLRHINLRHITR
jgi:hypothetical protein